jgi:transposase
MGLVEPLIPPGKRGGDKRTVIMRDVVNGLMYILSTGCQWRAIPKDLPPRSTLYDYFDLWSWDGALDLIHHELYVKCRVGGRQGGEPHGRARPRPPARTEQRIEAHSASAGPSSWWC